MKNNTNNVFEVASQKKFRYPYKGMITTEDLWDLTPEQLDIVYKALNKELLNSTEGSLLSETVENPELHAKIEIVKHIFDQKQATIEFNKMAAERSAKKQHILSVIAKKRDDALENLSEDELLEMLNELGG